jgi:hypothetical protein
VTDWRKSLRIEFASLAIVVAVLYALILVAQNADSEAIKVAKEVDGAARLLPIPIGRPIEGALQIHFKSL